MDIGRRIALICIIAAAISPAYGQEGGPGPTPRVSDQTVSVEFDPSQPRTGDDIKLKVKVGGGALRAEVRWFLNDEQVTLSDCNEAVSEAALGVALKDGDRVTVSVTPFDAENVAGATVKRNVTVGNAPPHIRVVEQKVNGGLYTAKLEATDPEGEAVSFTLQQGPRGMSVDSNGNVAWRFGQGTSGKFDVRVSAKDPQGGEAVVSYSFAITRLPR